ncbi:MAG: hypothetical protein AAB616_01900 [Patescibacteria group bacterium]
MPEIIKANNEYGVKYVLEREFDAYGRWLSDRIVKISSNKPKSKKFKDVSLFSATEDD